MAARMPDGKLDEWVRLVLLEKERYEHASAASPKSAYHARSMPTRMPASVLHGSFAAWDQVDSTHNLDDARHSSRRSCRQPHAGTPGDAGSCTGGARR
eukprot:4440450-Pleurochrysis_carterae.AAC.1